MSVPLSLPEQIEAGLQARLAAIVADGSNYNYTVNACLREPEFHGGCLDSSKDVIYVLSPAFPTEEEGELASNRKADTQLRLHLTLCKKFLPKSELPFSTATPRRVEEQNKVVRDAKKKIAAELAPGATPLGVAGVYNIEVVSVDRSKEFTYIEGWAVAQLRVTVSYEYRRSEP